MFIGGGVFDCLYLVYTRPLIEINKIKAKMSSLFDSAIIWKIDPLEAFKAFVTSLEFLALGRRPKSKLLSNAEHGFTNTGMGEDDLRPLRASSANVYIHMFSKFLRWMDQWGLSLYSVNHEQIRQFLEATREIDGIEHKVLNSSIRLRYCRLLERVFTHIHIEPNPARHAIFAAYQTNAAGHDQPKAVLTEEQQARFMQCLPEAVPFTLAQWDTPEWKRRRDRALLAMLLGAGLKVSEVVGIHTDMVGEKDQCGSVPVTITPRSVGGTSRQHQTQLRPFAALEVLQWREERILRQIPGELLFPANLDGKKLDKSTIYLLTKATYAKAQISVARKGPRTLRNSFAVRELEAEEGSVELTGEFLGLHKRKSTEKYLITELAKKKNPKKMAI